MRREAVCAKGTPARTIFQDEQILGSVQTHRHIRAGLQAYGVSSKAKDVRLLVQKLNEGRGAAVEQQLWTDPAPSNQHFEEFDQAAPPKANLDWQTYLEVLNIALRQKRSPCVYGIMAVQAARSCPSVAFNIRNVQEEEPQQQPDADDNYVTAVPDHPRQPRKRSANEAVPRHPSSMPP